MMLGVYTELSAVRGCQKSVAGHGGRTGYAIELFPFQIKRVTLYSKVTKRVYFIGNERRLIAHDSNRLRFS